MMQLSQDRWTDDAYVAISLASVEAEQRMRQPLIGCEYILLGLLLKQRTIAYRVLTKFGLSVASVRVCLGSTAFDQAAQVVFFDEAAKATINQALVFASERQSPHNVATTGDMLHALMLSNSSTIKRILEAHGTTPQQVLFDLLD